MVSSWATLAPPGPDVKVSKRWIGVGLEGKLEATTLIFEKVLTFIVPRDFCDPVGITNLFWETLAGKTSTVGIKI